jgi:hypothetical protein
VTSNHEQPHRALHTSPPSTALDPARTEAFRTWLTEHMKHDRRSLHAIEVAADIRGNALGKFLRGERGSRHSLTPLMIGRLAPVLYLSEVEMLVRAGHLSQEPWRDPIETVILAQHNLDNEAKRILIALVSRLATEPAAA